MAKQTTTSRKKFRYQPEVAIAKIPVDPGLLLASLFLIGLGVVQVYSSSFIFAIENYNDGLFFFRKQLSFALLAIVVMLLTAKIPWKYWEKLGPLVFVGSLLAVAATYIPGIGVRVGGAHRWIQLPLGLRVEPSEFFKMSYPFWVALITLSNLSFLGRWKLPSIVVLLGCPLVLLIKQPDFGSFAICAAVLCALLFVQGLRWHWVIGSLVSLSTAFYFLIVNVPYRKARLLAFLDPWSDPEAKGFQIIQSLLSFYSGGLTGSGLGQGQGKLFFLPEAHTDFTAAVLGEEMGFIGIFFVLIIYGFIAFRGFQITARCENKKQATVAMGLTLVFSLASFLNFAVVMGLLPTKGLALPFISYGGSSLIASAMAIGILLNIDREAKAVKVRSFKGVRIG